MGGPFIVKPPVLGCLKKCQFKAKSKEVLFILKEGRIFVSEEGIQTGERKINSTRGWPVPRDKHELRSFLGLCSYYRRFVQSIFNIAAPLQRMTEEKVVFRWTQDWNTALRRLKAALCSSQILSYPKQ